MFRGLRLRDYGDCGGDGEGKMGREGEGGENVPGRERGRAEERWEGLNPRASRLKI